MRGAPFWFDVLGKLDRQPRRDTEGRQHGGTIG
jgi:hypothetical protein